MKKRNMLFYYGKSRFTYFFHRLICACCCWCCCRRRRNCAYMSVNAHHTVRMLLFSFFRFNHILFSIRNVFFCLRRRRRCCCSLTSCSFHFGWFFVRCFRFWCVCNMCAVTCWLNVCVCMQAHSQSQSDVNWIKYFHLSAISMFYNRFIKRNTYTLTSPTLQLNNQLHHFLSFLRSFAIPFAFFIFWFGFLLWCLFAFLLLYLFPSSFNKEDEVAHIHAANDSTLMNNGLWWFRNRFDLNTQKISHKFWIRTSKTNKDKCKRRSRNVQGSKSPQNCEIDQCTSTACILISKRKKRRTNHSQIIRLLSIKIDQNVEEIWAEKKEAQTHVCLRLVMIQKVNYPVQITAKCENYPFSLLSCTLSVSCIGWHKHTQSHDIDDIQQKLNRNPCIADDDDDSPFDNETEIVDYPIKLPKIHTHAMHNAVAGLCALC